MGERASYGQSGNHPGCEGTDSGAKGGFHVSPRREGIERSFAWMTRCRCLARDQEGLPERREMFITRSVSRRMLSHLASACA